MIEDSEHLQEAQNELDDNQRDQEDLEDLERLHGPVEHQAEPAVGVSSQDEPAVPAALATVAVPVVPAVVAAPIVHAAPVVHNATAGQQLGGDEPRSCDVEHDSKHK